MPKICQYFLGKKIYIFTTKCDEMKMLFVYFIKYLGRKHIFQLQTLLFWHPRIIYNTIPTNSDTPYVAIMCKICYYFKPMLLNTFKVSFLSAIDAFIELVLGTNTGNVFKLARTAENNTGMNNLCFYLKQNGKRKY